MGLCLRGRFEAIEKTSAPYGRDAAAALYSLESLRYLDWLPLPRTVVLCIGHIVVCRGRRAYSRYDPNGWGSATFSEVSRSLIGAWPSYLVIDCLLIGLLPLGSTLLD